MVARNEPLALATRMSQKYDRTTGDRVYRGPNKSLPARVSLRRVDSAGGWNSRVTPLAAPFGPLVLTLTSDHASQVGAVDVVCLLYKHFNSTVTFKVLFMIRLHSNHEHILRMKIDARVIQNTRPVPG